MTSKRANWLFLSIILAYLGVEAVLIFAGEFFPDSLVLNFLLCQGILLVPTLLFLLLFERRKSKPVMPGVAGGPDVPVSPGVAGMSDAPVNPGVAPVCMWRPLGVAAFHRVKVSTLLMVVLCTLLIMPLGTALNVLTMFFTDNAIASLEGDIIGIPFPVMAFIMGIFGPFCEEFVFRGVIYGSYKRDRGYEDSDCYSKVYSNGISAILLSSLLFGLMHMNFNQAVYAFAYGIFLALLVEAAGSLWASVCCHMFFNTCQVVLMYVSGHFLESVYGQAVNEMAGRLSTQELLVAFSFYLVVAVITTPIAGCVIVWIAGNEGRQEAFKGLFRRRGRRLEGRPMQPDLQPQQPMQPPVQLNLQLQPAQQRLSQPSDPNYLLSVPLIVAVVLCLGFMSLELFLV